MTPERLRERLTALPLGGVEVQSQEQVDRMVQGEGGLEARKAAAVVLGEACSCSVTFIGAGDIFVRFTKHQSRADVVTCPRLPLGSATAGARSPPGSTRHRP